MTTPECPRITLVEALRDGRLGPQERASMDRHLASCAACADLARALDKIGDAVRAPIEPATPLEHQRARLALLRRAMDPSSAPARAPLAPRFVLAVAALAAAIALGWLGGGIQARSAQPQVALHMRPPPRLATARETTLRPSDDARFERSASAGLDVVTLSNGTLDLTVRPLAPGQRFVVRTADAEVEVRGTAFRVEASDGKIRGVSVAEGAVEVRYAGFAAVIPSGGSWRATNEALPPPPSAAAPPSASPPSTAAPSAPPSVAARTSAPPSGKVAARSPTPSRRAPEPVAVPPPPPESPPAQPPEPAPPPPPVASPASRAFADAMAALRRGDYVGSVAQLDGFASSFPADARADEAEYLRAIALQRAGRTTDAAAAARRYLSMRPRGAHRSEARLIARE